MFDITAGTLESANDLKAGQKLKLGDTLVILPVSGAQYTVKKGDTITSLAKISASLRATSLSTTTFPRLMPLTQATH